nr:PQQ-like beta-propeller repeat protein [Verrucomicrobiota bacterium]
VRWSATENVKWKAPLPERGNSTPIVWEDRVFLTQAVGARRTVLCLNRKDGQVLWQAGPTYEAREESHRTNSYCSASPVTDGERVIAWFGSAGLHCFGLDGKELWKVDLGRHHHEWGYASSPVLHGDLCFLNFGPGERTFLAAFDKRSGKEVWRVDPPRLEAKERTDGFAGKDGGVVGSWSTPLLVKAGPRQELVMTWPEKIVAYEPATGKELWRCDGLNPLIYTSPIAGEGVIVGMGGYLGSTVAVPAGGSGDVTRQRLWQKIRDKEHIGAGVITGGHIYILNTPGTAQCLELRTGEVKWEQRLTGPSGRSESWSSMVLAGDRIYVLNQGGDTLVVRAAPKFELLAANGIERELTNASHAVSDGELFIRTHQHLWCIGAAGG